MSEKNNQMDSLFEELTVNELEDRLELATNRCVCRISGGNEVSRVLYHCDAANTCVVDGVFADDGSVRPLPPDSNLAGPIAADRITVSIADNNTGLK